MGMQLACIIVVLFYTDSPDKIGQTSEDDSSSVASDLITIDHDKVLQVIAIAN